MTDKTESLIEYLYAHSQKVGGFYAALALANECKAPRKLRKANKLMKKILRGWIKISEGKPVQPIAAKHFRA